MHPARSRRIKEGKEEKGPVLYWMSRDQRAHDNWALIHAAGTAVKQRSPLLAAFALVNGYPGAANRHYAFMLEGLRETAALLERLRVPFYVLPGEPASVIPSFVKKHKISRLITDFDPLRVKRRWKYDVLGRITIPCDEVDAHNIVPCWAASPKQEYGAYTFRPKVMRLMREFLEPFPVTRPHPFPYAGKGNARAVIPAVLSGMERKGGAGEAGKALDSFLSAGLEGYAATRNDPSKDGQSGLSPFLHFGQISAQRVVLDVTGMRAHEASREEFLDELVVRRELSDNFCCYNAAYDSYGCLPSWAKETLKKHEKDRRPQVYSMDALENADTADEYWNACQRQMVRDGKMHGYMRMYWGKKVLEWSSSPEEAFERLIMLNDRYEYDGRDPNGYAGIAWCFGLHDRPWGERPVFGKVRSMTAGGLKRKYDMGAYVRRFGKST